MLVLVLLGAVVLVLLGVVLGALAVRVLREQPRPEAPAVPDAEVAALREELRDAVASATDHVRVIAAVRAELERVVRVQRRVVAVDPDPETTGPILAVRPTPGDRRT